MTRWALLTGEYPPQPGGVADYTDQVARGLTAAGDVVTVYAPARGCRADDPGPGVTVRRLPGCFGPRGLAALDTALARRPRPDRVLIQYVPHAYGWKGMNLPFAMWVAARAGRHAPVWVMFHEVAFPFRWRPPIHAVLAAAHRVMARLVAGAASRVLVSVPGWEPRLRRLCPRLGPVEWLPIPSNIPVAADAPGPVREPPARGPVVGHFGTYGSAVIPLLEPALCRLLGRDPQASGVLLGRGGVAYRDDLVGRHPALAGRVVAPGELPPEAVAARLRGCDILIQPFIDGISSRRTSAMAGLANAVPLVSNFGPLSESVWAGAGGVALAAAPDPDLLGARAEEVLALPRADRAEMGRQAAALYRDRFSLEHTIARLRCPQPPCPR
ncbi:MAG: hypothetical protein JWO38_5371 [Gemmataceae bacterium]|nr:hypothetical protein [Gemmataceae bacterium]